MVIYIKNMVCSRCKMAVEQVFAKNDLLPQHLELGEVRLKEKSISEAILKQLRGDLNRLGFEMIDNKKSRLIERIKNIIITLVHHPVTDADHNLSEILSEKLHYEYKYLSNLFSETEGITIEKYFIAQKVEKIKELLMYDELTLSQIADQLHYSSVAYLSNQFKKETGLSPSFYKSLKNKNRRNIEDV